jgi:hypothetical protein
VYILLATFIAELYVFKVTYYRGQLAMLVMNNVYKIITFVIVPLDRFRLLCRSGVFCTMKVANKMYTLVLLLSIGIQILEIPIGQKNSHVS